uniref:Uncharacterized protein n=1 Tax=Plectus sambesii TaxID=2011161 RepID=A0A914W945_9BILA
MCDRDTRATDNVIGPDPNLFGGRMGRPDDNHWFGGQCHCRPTFPNRALPLGSNRRLVEMRGLSPPHRICPLTICPYALCPAAVASERSFTPFPTGCDPIRMFSGRVTTQSAICEF